jgi:alkanesulfonate monooxygenase SsuD/methylene tetrahydromethanopterin reductase-like flavin-dependent oxidoreductase (luciferase family)
MRLGLLVPLAGDLSRLPAYLAAAATTAEGVGFHSLWFGEHVVLFDVYSAARRERSPETDARPRAAARGTHARIGASRMAR